MAALEAYRDELYDRRRAMGRSWLSIVAPRKHHARLRYLLRRRPIGERSIDRVDRACVWRHRGHT